MNHSRKNHQELPGKNRGRGAQTNRSGRFEKHLRLPIDDGWETSADQETLRTSVQLETARRIITTNQSPDISFDQSINPYRGCEHGCSYCYARPSHAFMGLSPGTDFESQLFAKLNAAVLLENELSKPGYEAKTIALGTNTDPYQPIEKKFRITRSILEVLDKVNHPVAIVTKSSMVTRDIDILSSMARRGLAKVAISVTTLDHRLSRKMEPRASSPKRRLDALQQLCEADIPAAVMVAPIIPAINDSEIETILETVSNCGVGEAGYVLLRLPLEVRDLFQEWLELHFPDRAKRVISILRTMRGGKDYDSKWHKRMRGQGPYAVQIRQRFRLALKRFDLNEKHLVLRTDLFSPPVLQGQQFPLF